MADVVSPAVRSRMMAGIKAKNTKPEMIVRRCLHKRGFRFRLHRRDLPGRPDIVLPKYRTVIFVHGCFWHGHDCPLFKWPSTRDDFWRTKIETNRAADQSALAKLKDLGWRRAVIWECAIKGKGRVLKDALIDDCANWLQSTGDSIEIQGSSR